MLKISISNSYISESDILKLYISENALNLMSVNYNIISNIYI